MWAVYILKQKILFPHELSHIAQWIRWTFVSMPLRPWYLRDWEGRGGKNESWNWLTWGHCWLMSMHLFEEPGKDLTLHLICGCAWGAVKSWDGWGRELCCAPLVCPWDSEQTAPSPVFFLSRFSALNHHTCKAPYLGYLEGAKQERRM